MLLCISAAGSKRSAPAEVSSEHLLHQHEHHSVSALSMHFLLITTLKTKLHGASSIYVTACMPVASCRMLRI